MDAHFEDRTVRVARVELPRSMLLCLAVFAEVVVALAINEMRVLSFVHAGAIVAVGAYGIMRRDLAVVLTTIAYTTGSEVLWRQTRAPLFYLAAVYLIIVLATFVVVLVLRRLGKDARIAAMYALLLLPASIATVRTAGGESRELIAFALSGPIALAVCTMLTSQVTIAPRLYRRVLWVILVSAIGPLTIAVSDMRAEVMIKFTQQSNFATSGGFGPVQVSAALSMGMMAAVLLIIIERDRIARIIAGVLLLVLGIQTLLTFSRGGSFSVGIAIAVLAITQARNRRVRNRVLFVAVAAIALSYFVIFPRLEAFTGGMFQERFADTKTGRTELAANDLQIFERNFVFGVGPGMTKYQRLTYQICQIRSDKCRDEASSHTEFTRTLGEHGIPGIIALALLITLIWHAYQRRGPGRHFAVAWMAWAVAQMFYANLRISAVPVAFALAFLRFNDRSPPEVAESPGLDDQVGLNRSAPVGTRGRSLQTMGRKPLVSSETS